MFKHFLSLFTAPETENLFYFMFMLMLWLEEAEAQGSEGPEMLVLHEFFDINRMDYGKYYLSCFNIPHYLIHLLIQSQPQPLVVFFCPTILFIQYYILFEIYFLCDFHSSVKCWENIYLPVKLTAKISGLM